MKALLTYLFDSLSSVATTSYSVYSERAPEDAAFPYITFRLSNSFAVEDREDYLLDVDVWDNVQKSTDPTRIDTLTRRIEGNGNRAAPTGLDGRRYYATGYPAVRLYKEAKAMLPDPDEAIQRRHIRFRAIVFDATSS